MDNPNSIQIYPSLRRRRREPRLISILERECFDLPEIPCHALILIPESPSLLARHCCGRIIFLSFFLLPPSIPHWRQEDRYLEYLERLL